MTTMALYRFVETFFLNGYLIGFVLYFTSIVFLFPFRWQDIVAELRKIIGTSGSKKT